MWPAWQSACLACHRRPEFDPQHHINLGVVVHACKSSLLEVESGESEVQDHLQLHRVQGYSESHETLSQWRQQLYKTLVFFWVHSHLHLVFSNSFVGLEIKSTAFHALDKHSTTELHPQAFVSQFVSLVFAPLWKKSPSKDDSSAHTLKKGGYSGYMAIAWKILAPQVSANVVLTSWKYLMTITSNCLGKRALSIWKLCPHQNQTQSR